MEEFVRRYHATFCGAKSIKNGYCWSIFFRNDFPNGERYSMCRINDSVEYGICDGSLTNEFVPFAHWYLRGNDNGSLLMAIFNQV